MTAGTLRVWPQHLYSVPVAGRVGYCASGSRQWWAAHGLDWGDFLTNGIDAERLRATGDPLALRLVAHAEAMAEQDSKGNGNG